MIQEIRMVYPPPVFFLESGVPHHMRTRGGGGLEAAAPLYDFPYSGKKQVIFGQNHFIFEQAASFSGDLFKILSKHLLRPLSHCTNLNKKFAEQPRS